jgi:hypothetical protein
VIKKKLEKVRKRRKEGKEEQKANGDTHGKILTGGWRRKKTFGRKMPPAYLS